MLKYVLPLFLFIKTSLLLAAPCEYLAPQFSFEEVSKKGPLKIALNDIRGLLNQSFPQAKWSSKSKSKIHFQFQYKNLKGFKVDSTCENNQLTLTFRAKNQVGMAHAFYAFLQEKIGILFYHPKETFFPSFKYWPISYIDWKASPRFEKRGFHLHTEHPIELTEPLLNPYLNTGLEEVKTYITWLFRNQQNLFQFYLLRDIHREQWMSMAKEIVTYSHARGIQIGLALGLISLQQRAFQLAKPLKPKKLLDQVNENIDYLLQADWDFMAIDYDVAEHVLGLSGQLKKIRALTVKRFTEAGVKTFYKTHVVPKIENEREFVKPRENENTGIQIHTVMFYGAKEEKAPVYGLKNQLHMYEWAKEEVQKRETWYWPESAYWVTFDNSVPALYLPYLSARLQDILDFEEIGTHGHLTFSSGWEWGYWLIDWSIARWSWDYHGKNPSPMSVLKSLPSTQSDNWEGLLEVQEKFLKDKELVRFIAPVTPFTELSIFNKEFQPNMPFKMDELFKKGTRKEIEDIKKKWLFPLEQYALSLEFQISNLKRNKTPFFVEELIRSIEITALRARHRYQTLNALIQDRLFNIKRRENIQNRFGGLLGRNRPLGSRLIKKPSRLAKIHLKNAKNIRLQAMELVEENQKLYRYPMEWISDKMVSHTCYDFGYLYPVKDLFFWKRDEKQMEKKKFTAWFMKIWDFTRCAGIDMSLFRDRPVYQPDSKPFIGR